MQAERFISRSARGCEVARMNCSPVVGHGFGQQCGAMEFVRTFPQFIEPWDAGRLTAISLERNGSDLFIRRGSIISTAIILMFSMSAPGRRYRRLRERGLVGFV